MNLHSADLDAAARKYRGAAGRDYHEGKRGLHADAVSWLMALRAEKFQRHVRREHVVFELGVGAGWNLGRLQCARRIGCDAADFLEERIRALGIEFTAECADVPAATADIAICHHTLEHLLEPANALGQLWRILKAGGLLVLHVPWEREWRYARHCPDEPNHHLFTWNAQNLGNLVTLTGYRLERVAVCSYGYDRFAANLAVRLKFGERGFRLLRRALVALRPLREVEVLARKPAG